MNLRLNEKEEDDFQVTVLEKTKIIGLVNEGRKNKQ